MIDYHDSLLFSRIFLRLVSSLLGGRIGFSISTLGSPILLINLKFLF